MNPPLTAFEFHLPESPAAPARPGAGPEAPR